MKTGAVVAVILMFLLVGAYALVVSLPDFQEQPKVEQVEKSKHTAIEPLETYVLKHFHNTTRYIYRIEIEGQQFLVHNNHLTPLNNTGKIRIK